MTILCTIAKRRDIATMQQLPLELPALTSTTAADFVVGECNRLAVAWIERWPDWPAGILVLHGPTGSGRSHLAEIWRHRAEASDVEWPEVEVCAARANRGCRLLVDPVPPPPWGMEQERHLLHLLNVVRERRGSLLLVADGPPGVWPIELPDLGSRVRAAGVAGIGPPDDATLAAVLAKHFGDRQLPVGADVIAFLVARMERSFAAAEWLASEIDRAALAGRRVPTVRLAAEVLAREAIQGNRRGAETP